MRAGMCTDTCGARVVYMDVVGSSPAELALLILELLQLVQLALVWCVEVCHLAKWQCAVLDALDCVWTGFDEPFD